MRKTYQKSFAQIRNYIENDQIAYEPKEMYYID